MADFITTITPPASLEVVVVVPSPVTVSVGGAQGPSGSPGAKGDKGDAGAPGPQGPAGLDLTYQHDQSTPAAFWVIPHNLGKRPSVQVFDSAGDEVEGDIKHLSPSQLQITFSAPFSGVAYLN